MASQVLSGTGPFTYTNNTGQNVRVVIGYCAADPNIGQQVSIQMSFAGNTVNSSLIGTSYRPIFGKNLRSSSNYPNNLLKEFYPEEIFLASGQSISISSSYYDAQIANFRSNQPVTYNILIIPEAG
jgi:hypothetical protein